MSTCFANCFLTLVDVHRPKRFIRPYPWLYFIYIISHIHAQAHFHLNIKQFCHTERVYKRKRASERSEWKTNEIPDMVG